MSDRLQDTCQCLPHLSDIMHCYLDAPLTEYSITHKP